MIKSNNLIFCTFAVSIHLTKHNLFFISKESIKPKISFPFVSLIFILNKFVGENTSSLSFSKSSIFAFLGLLRQNLCFIKGAFIIGDFKEFFFAFKIILYNSLSFK